MSKRRAGRARAADPAKVRELFARAVRAIQAGDPEEGAKLLEKADALAPSNPQILFNLGYANHAAGRHSRAVRFYRRSAELEPGRPETWVNLAAAARAGGDIEEAVRALTKLATQRERDANLLNDLGTLLAESGRVEEAARQYQRALEIDPGLVDTRVNLADVLQAAGRVDAAEAHYRHALDVEPGALRARRALADLLDRQSRVDEAAAVLLDQPGDLSAAADLVAAGNLELRRGRAAEAEAHYLRALDAEPGLAAALDNLGLVRVLRGDREGAERLFRQVLEGDRHFTEAWRHLAALRRFRQCDDEDIQAMQRLSADPGLSDQSRMHLGFALGKALDDCGRYEQAFEHFRAANALRRRATPFDAEALADHARRIREVFHGDASSPGGGDDSLLPVYIVGMPRTGTTLLEQMLSAHPAFHGGGELLLVNRLIANLESAGEQPYPECARALTADAVSHLAGDYLAALRELAPEPGVARISDKMPYNFFHLGLVRMLFPRARILHCTRHPLDTCLSAWFNYFPRGLDFTYDFADLAAVYGIYREMMNHWRAHPNVEFLDVGYEALVGEPEPVLGATLEYLGLQWDDAVLEFHRRKREVRTLSAWQVRQPLHTASRERWRHYSAHIGALRERLAPWLQAG